MIMFSAKGLKPMEAYFEWSTKLCVPFDVLTIYLATVAGNAQSTTDKYLMRI